MNRLTRRPLIRPAGGLESSEFWQTDQMAGYTISRRIV